MSRHSKPKAQPYKRSDAEELDVFANELLDNMGECGRALDLDDAKTALTMSFVGLLADEQGNEGGAVFDMYAARAIMGLSALLQAQRNPEFDTASLIRMALECGAIHGELHANITASKAIEEGINEEQYRALFKQLKEEQNDARAAASTD